MDFLVSSAHGQRACAIGEDVHMAVVDLMELIKEEQSYNRRFFELIGGIHSEVEESMNIFKHGKTLLV